VGHSAGGWLGRAFLGGAVGSGVPQGGGDGHAPRLPHPSVASLVTLGSPHRPPAPRGVSGAARDMTGGALGWVDETWPGAAFGGGQHGVGYVAVAGRAVRGCGKAAKAKERTLPGYAHAAYVQVRCSWGGGVSEGAWGLQFLWWR